MILSGVHHSAKGTSLPSQHLPGPFSNGSYVGSIAPASSCILPQRGGGVMDGSLCDGALQLQDLDVAD